MKIVKNFVFAVSLSMSFHSVRASGVQNPTVPSKVARLGKNKIGPYVVFDQGSKTGFVIGRDVCVYNSDGEKLTCSVVIRTKPTAAAIQISEEERAKVALGQFVWPEDLGAPNLTSKNAPAPVEIVKNTDVALVAAQEDDPPEPILPPLLATRIQVHISPTFALPIWMNDLRFNPAARVSGEGKIWESGDTIKGSVIGFGGRYYLPKNGRGDSAIDLTYHFVPQRPVKDDFDLTDASTTILSSVWSHHYRLRYLRGATVLHSENHDLLIYSGLGYDYLRALFKSTKTGGSTGDLVSGKITGHGLEIPVVATWQQHLGGWMLVGGMDMSLPIGVFGVTQSGKLSYSEDVGEASNTLGSVYSAVNVRRGWFALAFQFGVGSKF